MGTKLKPGAFDCYGNALPDEPMFVLLARDPAAPATVNHWAMLRENRLAIVVEAGEIAPEAAAREAAMLDEARACAMAMRAWRAANWPARRDEARAFARMWRGCDDAALPEDAAIAAHHPCTNGSHAAYMEAMRLVGARHSKHGLVELVSWLLQRAERAEAACALALPILAEDRAVMVLSNSQVWMDAEGEFRPLPGSLQHDAAPIVAEYDAAIAACGGVVTAGAPTTEKEGTDDAIA